MHLFITKVLPICDYGPAQGSFLAFERVCPSSALSFHALAAALSLSSSPIYMLSLSRRERKLGLSFPGEAMEDSAHWIRKSILWISIEGF